MKNTEKSSIEKDIQNYYDSIYAGLDSVQYKIDADGYMDWGCDFVNRVRDNFQLMRFEERNGLDGMGRYLDRIHCPNYAKPFFRMLNDLSGGDYTMYHGVRDMNDLILDCNVSLESITVIIKIAKTLLPGLEIDVDDLHGTDATAMEVAGCLFCLYGGNTIEDLTDARLLVGFCE